MTTDEYGVPLFIFGNHQPDFFPMLGRLIALASVVERDARTLAARLAPDAKALRRSQLEPVLTAICDKLARVPEADRAATGGYVEKVSKVGKRRNDYAHSLWPSLSPIYGANVVGWRQEPWSAELRVGKDLETMRDDVTYFSDVVTQWNDQIVHIYNRIRAVAQEPAR